MLKSELALDSSLDYVWSKYGATGRKPGLGFLTSWLKPKGGGKPKPKVR
jgi:hypothetical protein